MGQQEVLDFLESATKPLSNREISQILNESVTKISRILKTLSDHGEVKSIKVYSKDAKQYFNSNRILKLYYHPNKKEPEIISGLKIKITIE